MRGQSRLLATLALVLGLLSVGPLEASSATKTPCIGNTCATTSGGGATTETSGHKFGNLPAYPGDDPTNPVKQAYTGPTYVYSATSACTMDNPDGQFADVDCMRSVRACATGGQGPGPLTRIWRRLMQDGAPYQNAKWVPLGVTCYPNVVGAKRPRLTMAMIVNAFHHTAWANTSITTQPVGDVTLVGLPVFYQVHWSTAGYQPGEVDTVDPATMLGYTVQIRPRLIGFTYDFGDGDTFGPTPELGGVYPVGTITHPYLKAGKYPAKVTTTFAADFRINGGDWAPVPDDNPPQVPGTPTTVTVRTAVAHLVAH